MWFYRLSWCTGRWVVRRFWRLGLAGRVLDIPDRGPLIVAANHASFLDPWFLGIVFPRPVRYLITRDWYDRSALWRAFFRANGTIPVSARDAEETIASVCEALGRGEAVGIFPEGAISRDGKMRRLRPGVALIAARSGAPVLPVGLRGSFEALPRHRRLPRFCRVTVHVGEALRFPGAPVEEAVSRKAIRGFLDRLRAEIARLAGQEASAVDGVGCRD